MEKSLNPGSWPESGQELYAEAGTGIRDTQRPPPPPDAHTHGAEAAPVAGAGAYCATTGHRLMPNRGQGC